MLYIGRILQSVRSLGKPKEIQGHTPIKGRSYMILFRTKIMNREKMRIDL